MFGHFRDSLFRLSLLYLLFLIPQVALAQDAHDPTQNKPQPENVKTWQFSSSISYSSGDFGTNSTTDFIYIPFTMKRLFERGDISFTVPFVSSTTDGQVVFVNGAPTQIENDNSGSGSNNSGSGSSGSGGSGSNSGKGSGKNKGSTELTGQIPGTSRTESGLGDLVLRGRYYLVDEANYVPLIAVTGRIKFPTADEDRGLGTGEFDKGFGFEFSKFFGDDWIGYADVGYTFIGDPPGLELQDQWYFDFGAGYYFTDFLIGDVLYEERRALVDGQSNPRDFLFSLFLIADSAWRVNTSFMVGLSDGAPDYELTGGLGYRF